jgi:hypothetical protein
VVGAKKRERKKEKKRVSRLQSAVDVFCRSVSFVGAFCSLQDLLRFDQTVEVLGF